MGKYITATMFTGFMFAFAANAQGGNLVSVVKDANGKDKTLQISVADPADFREFAKAFPQPISLSDTKNGIKIAVDCASDQCVFNIETKDKRYRQQLDEAVRSVEMIERPLTFPLWDAMNVTAEQDTCHRSDTGCVEFQRKKVETHDGRFDLNCLRRKYSDHRGEYETVECDARYNLHDLF